MEFWETFWAVTLAVSLSIFALLGVVVGIGGFFDVRAIFRNLDKQHAESPDDEQG